MSMCWKNTVMVGMILPIPEGEDYDDLYYDYIDNSNLDVVYPDDYSDHWIIGELLYEHDKHDVSGVESISLEHLTVCKASVIMQIEKFFKDKNLTHEIDVRLFMSSHWR